MNSTTTTWTAQTPSGFALPTCGHAFEATLRTRASVVTTGVIAGAAVVRQRQESVQILATDVVRGGFKGDMDLATAYFPGTSAWRPPIC